MTRKMMNFFKICFNMLIGSMMGASDTKFRELTLYIAEKCKDDPYFGAIKLNKILFLADFNNYALKGESITGAKYVHREKGPVPNEMPWILSKLESDGHATIKEVPCFHYMQKRLIPLKTADLSHFTSDELALVDEIIQKVWFLNGTEISDQTHKLLPYRVTKEGEEIPYYTVYVLHKPEPTPDSINWAKSEIERLKQNRDYPT